MSKLESLLALANEAAELGPDMTEVQKGGGGRLLPEGYAFGRLVEYIELGQQPQEFNGKAKDPKAEAVLGFALWGVGYQNDDGTPYIIRPYSFSIDRNEKARAFKLFKALNWEGTARHFGQLLGKAFLVKIVHVPKSKTDTTVVSRIDLEGFLPPLDPVTKQPYPIPPARDEDLLAFFWDKPTKDAWDALFIEGQYEAKDGKPAASKNRVQETILAALDFQGSPLQQLLAGTGFQLPEAAPALPNLPAVPAALPQPTATSTLGIPAAGAVPAAPSPSSPGVIPLPTLNIPAIPAVPAP